MGTWVEKPLNGDTPTIELCLEVSQGSGGDTTISFLIFLGDFWALSWKNFSPVSLDDLEESCGNGCRIKRRFIIII